MVWGRDTHPEVTGPRSGRNPLAIFLLIFLLLTAVSYFVGVFTGRVSNSVTRDLPPVVSAVWNLLVFGGALLTVVGIYHRDRYTALLLERVGVKALSFASFAFSALLISRGLNTFGGALFILIFGICGAARVHQITSELDKLAEDPLGAAELPSVLPDPTAKPPDEGQVS